MADDRFDEELARRLRAYESRMPEAGAGVPDTDADRRPRWPILGVGVLAAVAAVLAVAVVLSGSRDDVGEGGPTPSPSASASPVSRASSTAEPSASASLAPTGSPSAPASNGELRWTETAAFGVDGGASSVNALARYDAGLIAVGVAYDEPLPILGPTPPSTGQVWRSTDGSTWEDATPAETFAGAELRFLVQTADGALIAHGWAGDPASELGRVAATWRTVDGTTWTRDDLPFPAEAWPMSMAQGAEGAVAIVVEPSVPTMAVWWSGDGVAWERVQDLGAEGSFSVGAGDEGFVVAGHVSGGDSDLLPTAFASGDGRSWVAADVPPGLAVAVAGRGGDWAALSRPSRIVIGEPASASVWTSTSGLAWDEDESDALPLVPIEAGGGACTEAPSALFSAGDWLVAGTIVSYPCSEGGVQTQGTQWISLNGDAWNALPFGAVSSEVGLGTRIGAAIEVDGRLVLAGDQDRVATFWLGEAP